MSRRSPWQHLEGLLAGRYVLPLILLLAAFLRVWHVFVLSYLPSFDHLLLDSAMYDSWAQQIAAGDWLGGSKAFYMDPLYPYLLSLIYRIFGHDLLLVRLVQVCAGVGTCALVAAIGKYIDGRAVGNLAALIMALYAPAIFNECEIEKTAFGVFFVTAALALALRGSVTARFWSGVLLALATLTRGNLIAFVPLGALYFLMESPADDSGPLSGSRHWPGGIHLKHTAAFVFGVVLVLSPVLLRNHHVSGEWILTTSQAGANFYTGNNPSNRTGAFEVVPFVRPYPAYEESDFLAEAERRSGRAMSPREASGFWFRESFRHMTANPVWALNVMARKVALFWSDVELPDGSDLYFIKRYSPALRLSLLSMGWVFPLALFGMWCTVRKSREARLLAGFILIYSMTVIVFFIFSRYRLHVVPALAVFASLGIRWNVELLDRPDVRRISAAWLIGGMLLLFSQRGAATFGLVKHEWAEAYEDMAMLYESQGNYTSAQELFQSEMRLYPERSQPVCALGRISQKVGDDDGAISLLNRCLEMDENYPEGWYALGLSHEKVGNRKLAQECFERQLFVTPGHEASTRHLRQHGFISASPIKSIISL
jgi:4-amino-4-deoxy-L-arabinose transferase-like glycosyltransferase